jgi:hypothetical protein
MRYVSWLH